MSITVAVTGGIGAGKSTVAGLLAASGAVVIDSDRLAREVVGVGTPGLMAITERFGSAVIAPDGSLDRPALASVVFADPASRQALEAITHPLVRSRFTELQSAAPRGSVVVNDIPLLTTVGAAAAFHLVIGVGAPETLRVARLVGRGLTATDARARIAAQIDDGARRALCDVWIDNGSSQTQTRHGVRPLWSRLAEFAANKDAGRAAARGGPVLVAYDPQWPDTARRLIARVRAAVGDCRVDHVGSTAVPDLPATDVIDLQLTLGDLRQAEILAPLLAAAGFPPLAGFTTDTPHPLPTGRGTPVPADPDRWRKTLHANSDPGQRVNLHLRVRDWPNWAWSLRFRDWLRADPGARSDYLALKEQTELAHGQDSDVEGYANAEEAFLTRSDARIGAWADATGWSSG